MLVPAPDEYVALGAARQAAWALAGPGAPAWPRHLPEEYTGPPDPGIRQRLASAAAGHRGLGHGRLGHAGMAAITERTS